VHKQQGIEVDVRPLNAHKVMIVAAMNQKNRCKVRNHPGSNALENSEADVQKILEYR
jgi:hypothetical protein